MFGRILDFFVSSETSEETETLISRWLSIVFSAILGILFIYLFVAFFINFNPIVYFILGTFVFVFVGLLAMLRAGHGRLARLLFVICATIGWFSLLIALGAYTVPVITGLLLLLFSRLFSCAEKRPFYSQVSAC